MFDILLSYLVFLPSTVLCLFPMKDRLKYSLRRTVLSVGVVLIAVTCVSSLLEYFAKLGDNTLLIPLFAAFFLAYQRHLQVHISKSLAVFSSSIALITILTNFSICFTHLFQSYAPRPAVTSLFQFGISVAVTLLLMYPYSKYGSTIINEADLPRVWYTMVLISAAFFTVNMCLLPIETGTAQDHGLIFSMIFALTTLLILWLLMQVFFYFTVTGSLEMYRTKASNRILEMKESQFAAQQRYLKGSEKVRHDFRQSIRSLSELYDAGDYDALGRYLRQYVDAMPRREVTSFCSNTALNALLNYYVHIASQNQIDFTIQIQVPDVMPVSDVDLCSMVGNILENAILACQKVDERFIQFSVVAEDNIQLYIVAVNSFDGKVREKDGVYLSTNHRGTGLGLLSITSTAEAYHGMAQFSHEGKQFYSNVAIPLQ